MSWTRDRLAQLEALWASGKTASDCARILGGGLTRHAVIGMVHRKGMQRSASAHLTPRQKINTGRVHRSRASYAGQSAPMRDWRTAPQPKTQEPPAPVDLNVPPSDRVKLMDLKHDHCRYPIGDPLEPDFGFCGKKRRADSPYCEGHHALCHEGGVIRRGRYAARKMTDEPEPDVVEQIGDAA